jgi:hypothetical protein
MAAIHAYVQNAAENASVNAPSAAASRDPQSRSMQRYVNATVTAPQNADIRLITYAGSGTLNRLMKMFPRMT